jgi:hypothetical protein
MPPLLVSGVIGATEPGEAASLPRPRPHTGRCLGRSGSEALALEARASLGVNSLPRNHSLMDAS